MKPQKTRARATKKSSGKHRRTLIKILAVLLLIPVIVVLIYLIRYYYIFDSIIAQKLGHKSTLPETEIYAAPSAIFPGKRLSEADLLARVRRLGYAERSGVDTNTEFNFRSDAKGQLWISNDARAAADPGRATP